jgi:hypothetical protein
MSKFEKHHLSRLPHSCYSPDTSPSGFWLFGFLSRILKDPDLSSSYAIEKAIAVPGMKSRASSTVKWTALRKLLGMDEKMLMSKPKLASSGLMNVEIGAVTR